MNRKKLFSSVVIFCLFTSISPIGAQGTAFTYQGWLNQGGVPVNGLYDFQASLFTNSTGGSVFAGPITNSSVTVSNGLFIAALDFGSVFDGTSYWLELSVRTNGPDFFTVLSPRQQLTPTPYANFALTSSNLSGPLSLAQLPAGVVTNNSTGVTLSGSFTGDAGRLTNLFGSPLGDYGMNNIQALWGRMNQQGRVRILSIGDSTGTDVAAGLTPYLEKTIGVNGGGVTVVVPLMPYLDYTIGNPNLVMNIRPDGTSYSNWWGLHYGLSNSATLYLNRYPYRDVSSTWAMNTNVVADTAFYAWVNRPNGGSVKLEISTNGLPFYPIATIDTSSTATSLGSLYYSFPKTNVSWRMTGTGGGDGYAEVLMGGVFVTNGPGALMWNICSPGSDWSGFVAANANVLVSYLTNIQPDLIFIENVHEVVPQYVIDILSNCSPAQIVVMACPPSTTVGDDSSYRLNYTNRMTVFYNAPTNRFNHIAFCDPWSLMTDTNANALYGFYPSGDPVHFSHAGQLFKAHAFLQSVGLGDESLGDNISLAGQGSEVNLFNSESGVPVGVNFWNADGRFGTFAVAVNQPGGEHFLGLTAVRDVPEYDGLLAYNPFRQPAPVPWNGPFDVMTNFSLFWQSGSAMSLLVPGGPGDLSLNGILNRASYAGPSPELCRITRNGQMFLGYLDWVLGKPDYGNGVLSVRNAVYVDQAGSRQVLITNGNVAISGQFSGSGAGLTNVSLVLNTNAFAGNMVAGAACLTNMSGNVTITGVSGSDPTRLWSAYLLCVNDSASTWTVAFPPSCTGQGQGSGPVYYITNGTTAEFQLNGFGNLYTNVNWSPHW